MIQLLIADDDFEVCDSMKNCIDWERYGITVSATTYDGLSTYNYIMEHDPDIVFIDIQMPKLTGLEIIQKVRENDRKTTFIILSGYDNFEYAKLAIKYNVDDYLLKPVNIDEVLSTVSNAVKKIDSFKQILSVQNDNFVKEIYETYFSLNKTNTTYPIYPSEEEKKFFSNIQTGDKDSTLSSLKSFHKKVLEHNSEDNILQCYIILYLELYRFAMKRKIKFELAEHFILSQNNADPSLQLLTAMEAISIKIYNSIHFESKNSHIINKVISYINDNYSKPITLESAANEVFLSPAYLSTLFKQITGTSFSDYLNSIRIENAKIILENSSSKNYATAKQVGFSSEKYFSHVFKKYTGLTPGQYKSQFQ